jgi:hypothetical protein
MGPPDHGNLECLRGRLGLLHRCPTATLWILRMITTTRKLPRPGVIIMWLAVLPAALDDWTAVSRIKCTLLQEKS